MAIKNINTLGKTSNQQVGHSYAHDQVHAASAKAFVLYEKNDGKEVHRYYNNTLGDEYGKEDDALGKRNNHLVMSYFADGVIVS